MSLLHPDLCERREPRESLKVSAHFQEERIKELLITFGQLKFYALQKDEEGKSVRA